MPKARTKPRNRPARPDSQQRAVDRLVSELGHAINNPLFAARAGITLLSGNRCSDEEAAQLQAIEQELSRIATAMRELRGRVEQILVGVSHRAQLRHPQVEHKRDRTADQG